MSFDYDVELLFCNQCGHNNNTWRQLVYSFGKTNTREPKNKHQSCKTARPWNKTIKHVEVRYSSRGCAETRTKSCRVLCASNPHAHIELQTNLGFWAIVNHIPIRDISLQSLGRVPKHKSRMKHTQTPLRKPQVVRCKRGRTSDPEVFCLSRIKRRTGSNDLCVKRLPGQITSGSNQLWDKRPFIAFAYANFNKWPPRVETYFAPGDGD